MGKRGRMSTDDLDVLNGTADGSVTTREFTRTKKGSKTTWTWDREFETEIWIFDSAITKNGPISTETIDKKSKPKIDFTPDKFDEPVDNDKLPKTKRKYFNPKNEKWLGYTRAKNLGLVD
jgi:hypothetical protein